MSVPRVLRRLSTQASTTISVKPQPSKSHLHGVLPSSVFPAGYLLTGLHSGVKKKAGVPDLALIISTSQYPTSAAGCFTRNVFKAAPVVVSEKILRENGGRARAVVVNSGCANAVTGKQGLEDALAMVQETDSLIPAAPWRTSVSVPEEHRETLVMSTGVIGQNLPISNIISGIRSQSHSKGLAGAASTSTLGSDFSAWERAAKAFMTTDTFPKLRARTFTINGTTYRMAGMDKGAGMIHPDMGPAGTDFSRTPGELHATLLACILTDAPVSPRSLQTALTYAVERSFNSISVDGDMSTNDTILVLANGAAAGTVEAPVEIDEATDREAYESFKTVLTEFAVELAKLVVRDGEGATKFVTVSVKGASTYQDAHAVASKISTSALVKTALYGEDANWGRILAATGSLSTLSSPIDPTQVSVSFVPSDNSSPLAVLVNGEPQNVDEVRAKEILEKEDFEVSVDLGGEGNAEAKYWTCDFSYEYVRINGDYRS